MSSWDLLAPRDVISHPEVYRRCHGRLSAFLAIAVTALVVHVQYMKTSALRAQMKPDNWAPLGWHQLMVEFWSSRLDSFSTDITQEVGEFRAEQPQRRESKCVVSLETVSRVRHSALKAPGYSFPVDATDV